MAFHVFINCSAYNKSDTVQWILIILTSLQSVIICLQQNPISFICDNKINYPLYVICSAIVSKHMKYVLG